MEYTNLLSIQYLESKQIPYKVLHLDSIARSAQDVKMLYACYPEHILKTLVLISNQGPLIAVVQGHKKLSLEKIKALFQLDALRLATAKEVQETTGYTVGGVSPFGIPKNVKKVLDVEIFDQDTLNMGAGTPFIGLELSVDNLKKAWDGYVAPISAK